MDELPPSNGRRALITGVAGQDGSYLAELLLSKGYDVWGTVHSSPENGMARLQRLLRQPLSVGRFRVTTSDLRDESSLQHVLKMAQPHEIYNLAAQTFVPASFDDPDTSADVTAIGAARWLEAVRRSRIDARFFQACSAEVFGGTTQSPQTESTTLRPTSPHGVAKAFAYFMTRTYREFHGMYAVNGILYNHESPRRSSRFVVRKITQAAAQFSQGRTRPVVLGNLHGRRDLGYAPEYVDAMWRSLQAEAADDYVIATGQSHSVRQLCERAFSAVGIPLTWQGQGLSERALSPDGRTLIQVSPHLFRPADADHLVGNAEKAKRVLNWSSRTSVGDLLELMVQAELASSALARSA